MQDYTQTKLTAHVKMENIFYDEKNKFAKKNTIHSSGMKLNRLKNKVHLITSYVNGEAVPITVIHKGTSILTPASTDK
jgi:hypothetical protein